MDPRDQTFMTIHNLTADANILFASDSILDILGYQPDEVRGKSAFEYFHPEEVPFARSIHSRGVLLDKAAVLHYARILSKSGQWMSCECCFTVVHNVLVASTSIYFKGERSERRARDAPQIRRIFSSSPRDPRYQMLEHLSPKFKMPPMEREPRAALILNRFTRNLSIMYATDAVTQILGVCPEELLEKPFYECIQPNCLDEAERCLESAKANESIAYLRFWYKDPRVDPNDPSHEDEGIEMGDRDDYRGSSPNESEVDVKDPGLRDSCMDVDEESDPRGPEADDGGGVEEGRSSNGGRASTARRNRPQGLQTFELEAVVSCTSDGLVVVLRRARPPIPNPQPPVNASAFNYENGLFAAPWGSQPIEPSISPELLYTFRPPFLPQYMPLRESVKAAGGPPLDQLMRSIRDVAVFAWAVTGINPSLASYGQGRPRIDAEPADRHPAWKPTTYPPPGDLSTERHGPRKETCASGSAFGGHNPLFPSDPPTHSYRTRHASLDENMYDTACSSSSSGGSSSRQAGWPGPSSSSSAAAAAAYPYGSGGSDLSRNGYEEEEGHGHHVHHHHYHHHHHHHHHNRRPPLLRPAFSYDALQDHARHQQQAWAPASASEAAARRCNLLEEEPWEGMSSSASSLRGCFAGYGGFGADDRGSGASWGRVGAGATAAAAGTGIGGSGNARGSGRGRYFWE